MNALVDEIARRSSRLVETGRVVGLSVGVIRDGSVISRAGYGTARGSAEVTPATIFRLGSITKLFTAVATMQLVDAGELTLDDPVLSRSVRMSLSGRYSDRVAVRHLLTHTGGLARLRSFGDVLRGSDHALGVPIGVAAPTLQHFFRNGVRVVGSPGERFSYSNFGFAILGQLVEDVTGTPFVTVARERLFAPLGMATAAVATNWDSGGSEFAAGHRGRSEISKPRVPVLLPAMGGLASLDDMMSFASAILSGAIPSLTRGSLELMMEPHYQLDWRLPGMGLAFMLDRCGSHRTVWHGGFWQGYMAALLLVPKRRTAVVVLSNSSRPIVSFAEELLRLVLEVDEPERELLVVAAEDAARWCGAYAPSDGIVMTASERFGMEGSARVASRRGRLFLRNPTLSPRRPLVASHLDEPGLFHVQQAGRATPVLFRDTSTSTQLIIGGLTLLERARAA